MCICMCADHCVCTQESFDRARKAHGTDEDILFVYSESSLDTNQTYEHRDVSQDLQSWCWQIDIIMHYALWGDLNEQTEMTVIIITLIANVQSNLAKGRIANLSPLTAANRFVRSCPQLMHSSFDPQESAAQTVYLLVQPFFALCTLHCV